MAEFTAIAGQKIFIGGVLPTKRTDFVAADFTSQSWTEIDGWSEKGELGDEFELIEEDLINRGRTAKLKGTANAGSMDNVFVDIPDDAGQLAFRAAARGRNTYAFKIEGAAPLTQGTGTPRTQYFVGLPMSAREDGGDANTADKVTFTIEVASNIVDVAAT